MHGTASGRRAGASADYDDEYTYIDIDKIPDPNANSPFFDNPDQNSQNSNDIAPSSNATDNAEEPYNVPEDVITNSNALAISQEGVSDPKLTPHPTHPKTALPPCCQFSVLAQGCETGAISVQTLRAASCQPPTTYHPLAGKEGLQLLSHIKRKVAFKFHSDRSSGVESEGYKQFNSQVDELSKARSGATGWIRYNQILDEELHAARQYVHHIDKS